MSITITGDNAEQRIKAGRSFTWEFSIVSDSPKAIVHVSVETEPADAPDWDVEIDGLDGYWDNYSGKQSGEFKANIRGESKFKLKITCPGGVRYADETIVKINAEADGQSFETSYTAIAVPSFVALKTQVGQEKEVAKGLYAVFKKKTPEFDNDIAIYAVDDNTFTEEESKQYDVYSVLCPEGLSGYVFIEGMNTDRMREKTRGIKKARSFTEGEATFEEIDKYLTPISPVVGISEGDIVQLIKAPFKNEKARVTMINEEKEEITVELIGSLIPIPVTVPVNNVKLVDEKEK